MHEVNSYLSHQYSLKGNLSSPTWKIQLIIIIKWVKAELFFLVISSTVEADTEHLWAIFNPKHIYW